MNDIEKIIEIGDKIYAEIKQSGINIDNDKENDILLDNLRKKYYNFSVSFPIVLRWMVQVREYNSKAFKLYLNQSKPCHSRLEFIESQAYYLTTLYRFNYPKHTAEMRSAYHKSVVDSLVEEDELFSLADKEATKQEEQCAADIDHSRRERLLEYLTKNNS